MSRQIGVVAAQVATVPFKPDATLAKFEHEVKTLAGAMPQFDLYVFPELYLSAHGTWNSEYPAGYERKVAQTIPGPLTDEVSKLARSVGKWIVPGSFYERDGSDIYNTSVAIDPSGQIVARYRKIFPWKPLEHTTPGEDFATFDIPNVGRFGLMICYDGWFPEVARALAWMGAEAILQPTATSTSDREQEIVMARANAIANQCYVVNPNLGGMFGTGSSVVVDPEGQVMTSGGSGEEFLTQTLDMDRVASVRQIGTKGLSRMWKQLRDHPVPHFPQYEHGFAAGPIMADLGPLQVRSGITALPERVGGK
ncbi:MAG: carbon-nitrogen hydrolase family protein [Chloroflexota bacterium]|nr:carbon-nitrogen hydrolase family protein [Chloroflexota bacterium]